jgi:hypothetical protein
MNTERLSTVQTRSTHSDQSVRTAPERIRLKKRKPSFHQKQIKFLAIFFGAIAILIAIGILLLLNVVGQPGF